MQKLIAGLPLLIVASFPLLYYGGHQGGLMPFWGIVLLFLGMAGPLLRRIR